MSKKLFLTFIIVSFSFFTCVSTAAFVYPIAQVSKPACRTLPWEQLSDDCKIDLPRIGGGDYNLYATDKLYRSVYSVLRGATYDGRRDVRWGSHPGVDIATSLGTPVMAIGDGVVTDVGTRGGRGNYIVIKYKVAKFNSSEQGNNVPMQQGNDQTFYSVYAHLSHTLARPGQEVTAGQVVGAVGQSGKATGPHLHFQIDRADAPQHPYRYSSCQAKYKQDLRGLVNNGYCREDMQRWTIDPIAFMESQGASLGNPSYDIVAAAQLSAADILAYEVDSFLSYRDLTYQVKSRKVQVESGSYKNTELHSSIDTKLNSSKLGNNVTMQLLNYQSFLLSPYTTTPLTVSLKRPMPDKVILPDELTVMIDHPTMLEVYPSTLSYIGTSRDVHLIPKVTSGTTTVRLFMGEKEVYTTQVQIGEPPHPVVELGSGSFVCRNIGKAGVCMMLLVDTAGQRISDVFRSGAVRITANKQFFVPQTQDIYVRALLGKIPKKGLLTGFTFGSNDLFSPDKIIVVGKKGLRVEWR